MLHVISTPCSQERPKVRIFANFVIMHDGRSTPLRATQVEVDPNQTRNTAEIALLQPYDTKPTTFASWRCIICIMTAALTCGITTGVVIYIESMDSESPSSPTGECAKAKVQVVQSIPLGSPADPYSGAPYIPPIGGSVPSWEAFVRLANESTTTLDFTAMYFDLLGLEDRQQFSTSDMEAFGADRGEAVFAALEAAAKRGVQMRILLGTLNDPMNSTEVRTLLSYPNVKARTWNPVKWYDGGIMHMKLWHSNGRAAYLGSANTDWKSLAQVQELGVLVNGTAATADLGRLFETFWKWASPDVPAQQMIVFSDKYAAPLTLPPWDINVPLELRVPMAAPFDLLASSPLAALSSVSSPQLLCPDEEDPEAAAANAYVSASPGGAVTAGRTFDQAALIDTVRSATTNLSLSVMDFLPASSYTGGHGSGPLYWPELVNAVLAVAYSKPVRVRVLVSRWAHTSKMMGPAMKQLADGLAACTTAYPTCAGSLEVRQFELPGWQSTTGPNATFPPYSRVNHAKFIVSDQRANVGTSNWEWGYMYQTAGSSWNTNDTKIVAAVQQIFDQGWESPFAVPL